MNKILCSTHEAACRLSIGRTKLFALLRDGEIKAVRLGTKTMIPASALEAFAATLPEREASCTSRCAAKG
ncbi:MAG: excisionase family DNA-binding protein [Hyphomicrobiales bacterium]|nr:excisionase family DNA-binding protein [Hyphomicrobiales bacterium]